MCAHTPAHLADIVVADNGSTDNSVELLTREFPQVLLLPFPRNYGFAEGYNRALDELDYEYAVLLNSDVEVTAHWLEPLLEFVESHPDVAACQPKIRSLREPEKFEYAGAAGGFIDRYGYPFCRGRLFGTSRPTAGSTTTRSTSSGPAVPPSSCAPPSTARWVVSTPVSLPTWRR